MIRSWLRRAGSSALIVAVVSGSVQIALLAERGKDPTFDTPVVDAAVYNEAAIAVSRGSPLIDDAFWQPPLFPLLLGYFYRIVGPSIFAAKIVLALVAVASCLLIFGLGYRLFSRQVGLVAGLIAGAYGPFVFFGTQLLPTGAAVFLDLLALTIWLRCLDRPRWDRWLAFGVTVGLATITVPNAGVLLMLALAGLLLGYVRHREARWSVLSCLLVLVGSALPIGAVTLRNYRVSGEWVLISTNGGINFFIGNGADSEQSVAIRPGEPWKRLARQSCGDAARSRAEQSTYFFRRAVKEIAVDPIEFVRGICRKLGRVINGREIPRNVDPYVFRDYSWLLSILMWRVGSFSFPFGLLAPFAAVGLFGVLFPRVEDERTIVGRRALSAFVIAYGASVVVFFVSSRYRLPMVMGLIVFAAAGVVAVWPWMSHMLFKGLGVGSDVAMEGGGRFRRRAAAATFLGTAILANLPLRLPTDGVNFRAELHLSIGQSHAARGDFVSAERFAREALAHEPRYATAAGLLASSLVSRGDPDAARTILEDALEWDSSATGPRLVLAHLHKREGRLSEAGEVFRAVLELDATSPDGLTGLADILAVQDRVTEAIGYYRSALRYTEDPGPIELRLADALVSVEAYEEAIARYRHALWGVEADPETLNRVAWLLATCPQRELRDCDQAVRIATDVCRATQYRNATALDTLAAAHAECGRFDESISWVRAAIALAQELGDSVAAETFRSRLGLYEVRLKERSGRKTAPPRTGRSDGE